MAHLLADERFAAHGVPLVVGQGPQAVDDVGHLGRARAARLDDDDDPGDFQPEEPPRRSSDLPAADDHAGRTYTFTGPALLSVPDQAAQLAAALDRPVEVVVQSLDEARAAMLASGVATAVVDTVIAGMGWVRAGRNAIITSDVAELLGRPPTRFAVWAHDRREGFLI